MGGGTGFEPRFVYLCQSLATIHFPFPLLLPLEHSSHWAVWVSYVEILIRVGERGPFYPIQERNPLYSIYKILLGFDPNNNYQEMGSYLPLLFAMS